MAVFGSPVFTNEGRALMTDIIANQGTAVFKEAWLSSTNYVGSEESLTAATFAGTFLVDNDISASIYDSTVIGTEVTVDNSTLLVDQNLYTIGIILDDNGTDVLLCVSTTSSPEPIPAFVDNPIKFAYQFMLTVSSTQSISIVGSLAGIVYKGDIRDVLTSSESDKPLSARMGKKLADEKQDATLATPLTINGNTESTVEGALDGLNDYGDALKDNLAANEESGAKNKINIPNMVVSTATKTISVTNNIVHIVNNSAALYNETANLIDFSLPVGTYKINGCGELNKIYATLRNASDNSFIANLTDDDYTLIVNDSTFVYRIQIVIVSSYTFSDKYLYPMLRDARIIDPTFAPYAETNLQLTRKTSGLSNENLVDNPFFTVNQRGFTSAIFQAGNVYTADRWLIIGSTIGGSASLSSSGMKLSRTGESTSGYLTQFLESLTLGKPYTLSVLFDNGTIESKTGIINSTADSISFSFANGLGSTRLYYFSGGSKWTVDVIVFAGSEFTIRAVKLEVGTVSTLANDVAPNYTTELLKCRRYFKRMWSSGCIIGQGLASNNTTAIIVIPNDVPMRAIPTVSSAGTWKVSHGGSTPDITSIALFTGSTADSISLLCSGTGLTPDAPCLLYATSADSYIDLSADL